VFVAENIWNFSPTQAHGVVLRTSRPVIRQSLTVFGAS
jgi:hypothetical protein